MSTDQLELFERFITSTTSPSSSLPRDTILGAITHFLSTLPIEPCRRLLRVISTADFFRDTAGHAAQVREAIKLGVRAGCDRATREDAEGSRWYTMKWSKSAAVDKWVQGLLDEATHAEGRRLDLLVALLLGVAAQSDSAAAGPGCSAGMQREVQEEVVLALEPRLGSEVPEEVETAHELLADVIEVVDTALLSLLELPKIAAWYRWSISRHLTTERVPAGDGQAPNESQVSRLACHARALGRVIQAMYTHPAANRRFAAQCAMLDCIETFRYYTPTADDSSTDTSQAGLWAYVIIASKWLDTFLAHPPKRGSRAAHYDARIAQESLLVLSSYASLIYAGAPVEGYERVLYGLLDVLVALQGSEGVSRLFAGRICGTGIEGGARKGKGRETGSAAEQGAEDAWWLTVLESVCREADAATIRDMEEGMHRRIRDPGHQPAFLAAHSLQLALLHAASDSIVRLMRSGEQALGSGSATERCVKQYQEHCRLLLEQYVSGDVTADQMISAYPSVVADIAHLDPSAVMDTLAFLDRLAGPSFRQEESTVQQRVRLDIRIASSPRLPIDQLARYLDSLATDIGTLGPANDRQQRTRALFEVILKEFPDAARVMGIQWWDAWQSQVDGTPPRAHL